MPAHKSLVTRMIAILLLAGAVSACSAAAAPCRATGSVVRIVPLIGDIVGGALETCGDVID
ncbi:MAG: hypothetical protein NXI19_20145 [Alphaproteobacteria bacterium]|nr:hypothetical protein [Alphaproteobacteria bacterium]